MGVFDAVRARLDRLFSEGARPDPRTIMTSMRDAVIEMKAAVAGLRDGVARTERELGTERRALEDAERRGALADDITVVSLGAEERR